LVPLALILLTLVVGGCSSSCLTSDQKLARLTPGMSYEEVGAVMGCQGQLVRGSVEVANAYAVAEWRGPRSLLSQTNMMFFDLRLLWYDSRPAPGF
jgi:hypothetical protein